MISEKIQNQSFNKYSRENYEKCKKKFWLESEAKKNHLGGDLGTERMIIWNSGVA